MKRTADRVWHLELGGGGSPEADGRTAFFLVVLSYLHLTVNCKRVMYQDIGRNCDGV